MPDADPAERVLILTPTGRDIEVTCEVLSRGGILCDACADLDDLLRKLATTPGALLIADEALTPESTRILAAALERQEPWSDLPILVATTKAGARATHERILRYLPRSGSLTLLERPVSTLAMLTTVRAALSARKRQYQLRGLLAELHANTMRLEAEREVRERFVAIMAHDLRGPLSTMRVTAELLSRDPEPAERRLHLTTRVARSVDRMDRMIRDLLDVHRIQAGRRLPLRLDRCDLGGIASDVAEELNVTHGERVVVHSETRVEGIWSAEELRRALWNLGSNAIKYGTPGTPIAFTVAGADDGARVSVHNEGAAIPPEEQAALFEPFGRARSAEASAQRGWGLGLALVWGCTEAHGGRVEVESSPGRGTTFTMRLPWDARPFQAPSSAG